MIKPISQNNTPTFTGKSKFLTDIGDWATDSIAYGLGKIAKTKAANKMVEGLGHFKKPSPRMGDVASIIYTAKLMSDTATSKKIEKEQKPALLINAALVTALSSTCAFLIDTLTDPITKNINNIYTKHYDEIIDNTKWLNPEQFAKGVSKMKSLTIFTLMVRILIPVLSVPITGKIKEAFAKNNKNNKPKTEENLQKEVQAKPTLDKKA